MHFRSSSSFYISDVLNVVYGGFSSRFWMLRKHICSMSKDDVVFAPFYSWNCFTIDVGYRQINLVIRGEKNISRFLKFLIWNIRTLDGKRGSADKVLAALNEQSFQEYREQNNRVYIDDQTKLHMMEQNENKVFRKIYFKFLILKVRAKISYMAF